MKINRKSKPVIPPKAPLDLPDEAGEESFPASDPPSWTLGQDKEHKSRPNKDKTEEKNK